MMLRHYNITVKGRVQGVAFRFNAQAEASKLDLTGYVKNLADGDVYIEAEGDEEKINKFINWCYVGPRLAQVQEVIAEESETKGFQTFELKR